MRQVFLIHVIHFVIRVIVVLGENDPYDPYLDNPIIKGCVMSWIACDPVML